jgi:cystathionine beta-lyase/cystathionine gamma-synthase
VPHQAAPLLYAKSSPMPDHEPHFGTRAADGVRPPPPTNAPARLPIYQSAGWSFRDLDEVDAIYDRLVPGGIYGSDGNPNLLALEATLASLEDAPAALATSAGMAALAAAFLSILSAGERVVAARELYGNTIRLLDHLARFGITAEYVDATDLAAVERALGSGARLVLVETISNPRLRVADLPELARAAHARGALLLSDNTLAGPYHCRPLAHGVDIVMESATKFLGGHQDIVIGALAASEELIQPARTFAVRTGMVPGAFDAWLTSRSIETLEVRAQREASNAFALAEWLERHAKVRRVHYPGLPSHPDHAVARRLLDRGFGAMVSFELDGGVTAVNAFLAGLRRIPLVLSFGGAQTTLSHPAKSSHRGLSEETRRALGIHDGLLRMSVGVEAFADLQADLDAALGAL